MAENIGLLNADGSAAVDSTYVSADVYESDTGDDFFGKNTPFIHGRDYVVDAASLRSHGTADVSKVTMTYRLWGEPCKFGDTMPTATTTSASPVLSSLSFSLSITHPVQVGMRVTGAGIPADTFISAIGASSLTMTRAATASAAGVTISLNRRSVGKVRLKKFLKLMLGYPYIETSSGQIALRRNLPEPLRFSANQWQFVDRRPFLAVTANTHSNTTLDNIKRIIDGVSTATTAPAGAEVYGPGIPAGTTITGTTLTNPAATTADDQKFTFIAAINKTRRWTHWATTFQNIRGGAPKAQDPINVALMYPTAAQGSPPDPQYEYVDIDFTFEELPFEPRIVSDPAVGGEYSRYTIYPEEASARLLQIRGGATWNATSGDFGQPSPFTLGTTAVDGTMFGAKEGIPKTIGENVFTWKWMDVPTWAYDWDAIQAHFGQINQEDFGSTLTAPFYVMPKECVLFETAQRYQKNNVAGEPLWDIVFFFRSCCLDDRKGYWNRLYNNLGYPQRYKVGGQDFFKSFKFVYLFLPYRSTDWKT